ncbi:MAG: peptide deformylase [Candidatus Omnitrophica bacterium]|nr:peptide deformylase [Candidatus Omnitrophota bacterium]
MELLEIKKYPNKILRKRCQPIEKIAKRELELFEKMLFTMRHFSGIGLAAPQIGILQRLIVADIGEGVIKLANPEIIKAEGIDNMEEGCLSVPDATVDIERPYEVIVKGLNEKGETAEARAKGLLARVLQYEIDHLIGKLIIDYMRFSQKIKFKLESRRF